MADTMSALTNVPDLVATRVARALAELDRLELERQGYRRLGMGARFDEDIDAARAPHLAVVDSFRHHCPKNGVDADAAIEALRRRSHESR